MENISIVFAKQFTNKVEFILHSPCNIPSKMFEMTVVVDGNYSISNQEELKKIMQPFLYRKVMNVVINGDEIQLR